MATPSSPSWQVAKKQSHTQQQSPNRKADSVIKNLFGSEEESDQLVDNALVECSFSSEYFSQSSMELDHSRTSKRLLFESPSQVSFITI